MRTLFLSEKRCISNLMHEKWGTELQAEPVVLKEHYSESSSPTKRPIFNCDFTLDFVEELTDWRERDGTMNTALPNTLGTDLHLFVDTRTYSPLHFELMFGEAFSIKYYAPYIVYVETAVREAVLLQKHIGPLSPQALLRLTPLDKSACARVLVVGGDVCFLYFPSEGMPIMRGSRIDLVKSEDRHVACYLNDDEIVCFDGWIRTEVTSSDWILVAQQEDAP